MKMYLISDNDDTRIGMRLAGVSGTVVGTKENFEEEVLKVLGDGEVGILLVSRSLADKNVEFLDSVKINNPIPLIVEIPDKNSIGKDGVSITRYIREAIGLNI